jgi:DNA mismatch endonuclease (patch repair protein)
MADVVDKATRSRMMAGIKGKDTNPEIFLRKALFALGFRFRLHRPDIPGRPDIVLPKHRALVLVHGCYWHGHQCRNFKWPVTNAQFWRDKIDANRRRDRENLSAQRKAGWRIIIVWECAIRGSMKRAPTIDVVTLISRWIATGRDYAVVDTRGLHIRGN